MRFVYKHFITAFFICCCCFIAGTASAQEEPSRLDRITRAQANEFYDQCLEQKYPANSTKSKKMFCACSAARFYDNLRQGDVMDLRFDETWQARKAKEKVLQYVYTPCIKTSMEDLLREECEQSTYLDNYPYISKNAYCLCQNRRMTVLFDKKFGSITELNKSNIDESISDPISSFMQNPIFESESAVVTSVCMKKSKIEIRKPKKISPHPAPLKPILPRDYGHEGHNH